jgi:hypothetical protein
LFGKGKISDPSVGKDTKGKLIEGSVEYWNEERRKLGLKALK